MNMFKFNAICDRYTGVGGDGDGRTGSTQGGDSSVDPVYSPPTRGACYQYAIVTEKTSTTKNVKICGTDRRERNVYTSRSNEVEVRFITSANVDTEKEYYFLLQFEGMSLGPGGTACGRARGVKTLGKFLTPVCLCSPSSTSWYRPKGGDACGWGIDYRM